MITRVTGALTRVLDEEVRLQVGPLEYQVLIAEYVRRGVQHQLGQELTFHTSHYFEGNPMQGKVVPRLLGFLHESDMEFFELFCTVDGIGTRKALKAMARPPKEVADAIARQDAKWLTTLPGVGASTAEKIVTALKRKVAKFSAAAPAAPPRASANGHAEPAPTAVIGGDVQEEAYAALMALGQSPIEARIRLDKLLATGRTFASTEEVLQAIFGK